MSRDERLKTLQWVYEQYKATGEAGYLADLIRIGGAVNLPWPVGMAEDVAALLDKADPWTPSKEIKVENSLMFYIYWRETEFKTGEPSKQLNMAAVRQAEELLLSLNKNKPYDTVQKRFRRNYERWREKLTDDQLQQMQAVAARSDIK